MRTLAAFCAGSLWLAAQPQEPPGALPPELDLLTRIRLHMLEQLQRQPNYTCVETVERSRRAGATRKFQLQDTLRLEVALVDGKEMFAWPGSRNFEDTDLRNMVTTGAIGNGNFALHARSIFEGRTATFEYRGKWPLEDRPSVRFDFRVPLMLSGYHIRVSEKEAVVGYHGSFYAEPESLDIQRIELLADDIPLELGLSEAGDRIDYARTHIGESEFLLPASSELVMVDLNGQESRNHVRFTGCRQFTGESVLSFGDPPAEDAPAATPLQDIELPVRLGLTLSLLDEIDTSAAAVGDPVRARLENDLKQKGHVLMSKGAVAVGRITRLERWADYTVLGLEFFMLESAGVRARIQASLESIGTMDQIRPRQRDLGSSHVRPGEGIVPLRAGRIRLSRGILMFWRT
jgi:hypothetical protein